MEPQEPISADARSEVQLPDDASTWTTSHVKAWLDFVGLRKYSTLLSSQHEVDGRALLMLNEDDLRLPPLQIEVLGDAKRLWWHISQLQASYGVDPSPSVASNRSPGPGHGGDSAYFSQRSYAGLCHRSPWNRMVFPKRRKRGRHSRASDDASVTDSDVGSNEPLILRPPTAQRTNGTAQFNSPGHGRNLASTLQPEISKLLIAFGYFVLSTWVTAMVMVVVHDRVPDMNTHPPLPDIVLDNVPLIPWAFLMSEVCASLMSMISVAVLIVHKHRFIVMRRFFALAGTIFLLRCVTMLITSLSVPGKHLNCKARDPGVDWIVKFTQAFDIWRGAGMSLQGVRSCGDYMFSGHTVALTLLNHFITEYTNRRMYFLHTFSWLLNMFGIFFILAAHEHYSIDVFIAFYISSRLFLYYHTLANNKTFKEMRSSRTRVWFPMLSYFERNVDGIVPNEYEWPFSWEYWLTIFHQVLPFIKMAQEKLRETAKSAELAAKSKKEFISSRLRRNPVGFEDEGVKETDDERSQELHIQRALARSGLSDTEGDDYLAHGAVTSDKIRKRMKKRNNLH